MASSSTSPIVIQDLGVVDYKQAWDYQERLFRAIIDQKLSKRSYSDHASPSSANHLLFCEHTHVYTLGKSGLEKHLLIDQEMMKREQIAFYKTNRGGDITYHGPGQVVGYPILDLEQFFTDIGRYMRALEEVMIQTLAEYGIRAGRLSGSTGVWLDPDNPQQARKICAMGVRTSHWVTMHGWALNVNTDLKYFNYIVPCGIVDKQVTSMEKELGRRIDMGEVKEKIKHHFCKLFEVRHAVESTINISK